jgi:hypothetical protein
MDDKPYSKIIYILLLENINTIFISMANVIDNLFDFDTVSVYYEGDMRKGFVKVFEAGYGVKACDVVFNFQHQKHTLYVTKGSANLVMLSPSRAVLFEKFKEPTFS